MMPKSTATSRPSRIDEQVAGMHVGMEEAVAQRLAQEALDHRAAERAADRPGGGERRRGRGAACRRSIRSSAHRARCASSRPPARGNRASSLVFSAISESAAASRRKSISIATERASVSTTSISRSRRASADSALGDARDEAQRCEIARRSARSTPGRSTFTATAREPSRVAISARCTCAIEAAATGAPKLTNSASTGLREGAARRRLPPTACGNGGIRSCRRLEVARRAPGRRCRAASPGTGRA